MAFANRVAAVPVSKVEVIISCKNLLSKDVTSKSDPICVMFLQDRGKWYEFGRTENIKNSQSPQFATHFEVDYYFEEVQQVKFQVYDMDNKTPDLNDDDYLGAIECTLGQIVSGSPYTKPLQLKGKTAGQSTITIRAEEVSKFNDFLNLSFKAQKLDDKDTFSKSDPFLEFSRQATDGTWQVVHRTEVIMDNLNPEWKPFEIKVQKLCAGDYNRTIRGGVYDYEEEGKNDLIGEFTTTVSQLLQAVDAEIQFPCINPKIQKKKKNYQNSGIVILKSCKISKEYSFLDYIFGGLQINFTVGIDFTASNGDPRNPQSLHYVNPHQPNEYQKAILAVGSVIQDYDSWANEYQKAILAVGNVIQEYDSDQLFPALGFGAKIPPEWQPSHEFAINFKPANPFCAGVEGICQAYTSCVAQVQLYGPTNFSPIIHHVARFAQAACSQEGAKGVVRNYFVLLIITDGVISDIPDTLEAIVHASGLPMSIIIVGVGKADFSAMNQLDGDDGVLRTPYGERARRDIVQFVPFRNFEKSPPAELAKHVLAEVPKQVTDYYKLMGIEPRPAPPPAAAAPAVAVPSPADHPAPTATAPPP